MIPFVDLKTQYRNLKAELDRAVLSVMAKSWFILGENVRLFEKEFAEFAGSKYAIGVNSGTDALALALAAVGVGPGDEVIVPVNTFIATALAVSMCGAVPRFVDVLADTANVDPSQVAQAVNDKTKAIVPVHLYGQPADMPPIMEIARGHGLKVVEDACQAHGAKLDGRGVGTFGDAACYSFYPGKNLGAYGDGGMVVTDSDRVRESLELARHFGQHPKNCHSVKGRNSRLDEIQAAVLRVKLAHLAEWNMQRQAVADMYCRRLASLPVGVPRTHSSVTSHVWHLFVIQVDRRDELMEFLKKREIMTQVHYPTPIHLQPAYAELGGRPGDFPVAESMASRILSLPMYPEMTEALVDEVTGGIQAFFSQVS